MRSPPPARPAGQARTRLARGGYSFSNTLVGFRSKQSVKRDLCGASGKKKVLESMGREWVEEEEGAWGSMPVLCCESVTLDCRTCL